MVIKRFGNLLANCIIAKLSQYYRDPHSLLVARKFIILTTFVWYCPFWFESSRFCFWAPPKNSHTNVVGDHHISKLPLGYLSDAVPTTLIWYCPFCVEPRRFCFWTPLKRPQTNVVGEHIISKPSLGYLFNVDLGLPSLQIYHLIFRCANLGLVQYI